MKQLNFFDAMGVKVLDAAEHERNVQELKRKAAQRTNEKKAQKAEPMTVKEPKAAPEQPTKKEKPAPTWEVHFFDVDGRQRMDWQRAKNEDNAKAKVLKEWGAKCKIYFVIESRRTLEEIEALD